MAQGNDGAKWKWIAIVLIVAMAGLLFVGIGGHRITGNVAKNMACKQVTMYKTEYRTERYETSAKNCDRNSRCTCLHKSWAGLGACDSCQCARDVEVQVPYTVEKCAWD